MGLFDIFKSKSKQKEREKYRIGMEKTRKSMSLLKKLFSSYDEITEELFDELEEIFVMADIGVETVVKFVDELKKDPRVKGLKSAKELQPIIIDKMFDIYLKGEVVNSNLTFNKNGLTVFLFVGVNGVGKTTTIAKVANKLKNEGYDVVLCDTAGRLQTKVNLMKELEKIKRVISREVEGAPQDTLLVIDATTGQNGLSQAKAFIEATNVTGIILTKLDGTAKGGIVLAIRDIYNIPIKFVTFGEKLDDIEYFDLENYIYGLFAEMIDEE